MLPMQYPSLSRAAFLSISPRGFYTAGLSEMDNWKIIGFAGLMAVTATGLLAFKLFGT